MSTKKSQKIPLILECKICHYLTCNSKDFGKHLSTLKHARNKLATSGNQKIPVIGHLFTCENCNKEYNDRTGLWRHKKICKSNHNFEEQQKNMNKIFNHIHFYI
jgi:hypothetical protein